MLEYFNSKEEVGGYLVCKKNALDLRNPFQFRMFKKMCNLIILETSSQTHWRGRVSQSVCALIWIPLSPTDIVFLSMYPK